MKISKVEAKKVGLTAGAIASGIVGGHVAFSILPKSDKKIVNLAIPALVSGGAAVIAMNQPQGFVRDALIGLSVYGLLKTFRTGIDENLTADSPIRKASNMFIPTLGTTKIDLAGIRGLRNVDVELRPTIDLGETMDEIEEVQSLPAISIA